MLISSIFHGKPLILYVAVHPSFQRKSLARFLLTNAIKIAKQDLQLSELFLVVTEQNIVAYELYKKVGFVKRASNWEEILREWL